MNQPQQRASAIRRVFQSPRAALTAANMFDFALQILTPVVLVRLLTASDIGLYRLFWLVVNTAMLFGVVPLTRSLFYFLPRVSPSERRGYLNQTILFLTVIGASAAAAISLWVSMLPLADDAPPGYSSLAAGFALVWIVASALDVLPSTDERMRFGAGLIVGLALLRTLTLWSVALATGELLYVLIALCALLLVKLSVLAGYVRVFHHHVSTWDVTRIKKQIAYVAPLAVASALYGFRLQADPWIVAHWFSAREFAEFSLAMVLFPLMNVLRTSISNTLLPEMSRLHAGGEYAKVLDVAARANVTVASIAFPAIAFLFAFADAIVELAFTAEYAASANVMRVYCFFCLALAIDASSLVLIFAQSTYAVRLNALCLILSLLISVAGALLFGLPGAALGAAATVYVETLALLRRAARLASVPFGGSQNWRALLRLLVCAIVAAALACLLSYAVAADTWSGLAQVAFAGIVCASAYLLLALPLRIFARAPTPSV